jgi:hypothetical protein
MMEGVYNFATWDMEDFGRLLHEKGDPNVTWKKAKMRKRMIPRKKEQMHMKEVEALVFTFWP